MSDQTATAMGSRLLKKWLDKPLTTNEIKRRQNMVESFLSDFLLLDEVRDLMKQVYDLKTGSTYFIRICQRAGFKQCEKVAFHDSSA